MWSISAETCWVRAFLLAGGPAPSGGVKVGRDSVRFQDVVLGGPVVGRQSSS